MKNKIRRARLSNFMLFHQLDLEFSTGINVISGENSTGKTVIIKFLYSFFKAFSDSKKKKNLTAEARERIFVEKFQGVFRPDGYKIGRLVNRKHGGNSKTENAIVMDDGQIFHCGFGNRQETHMELEFGAKEADVSLQPVYIPPKEIISSTENFNALYQEYQIAFEETYSDLCSLLDKPLTRGKYTDEQNEIIEDISQILHGRVSQKNHRFYLSVKGAGTFEMGLVSEGYRKLATIMYLILSGSLNKGNVIFWDEPEANMNPKMILPVAKALHALANMGVQVFVTTHSYFLQQAFSYLQKKNGSVPVRYLSFYRKDDGDIAAEQVDALAELERNAIMEEFEAVYDREQETFYEDDGGK